MQRCSQSIKKKLNTLKQDRLSEKSGSFFPNGTEKPRSVHEIHLLDLLLDPCYHLQPLPIKIQIPTGHKSPKTGQLRQFSSARDLKKLKLIAGITQHGFAKASDVCVLFAIPRVDKQNSDQN